MKTELVGLDQKPEHKQKKIIKIISLEIQILVIKI